jgi:hypothetical protein
MLTHIDDRFSGPPAMIFLFVFPFRVCRSEHDGSVSFSHDTCEPNRARNPAQRNWRGENFVGNRAARPIHVGGH